MNKPLNIDVAPDLGSDLRNNDLAGAARLAINAAWLGKLRWVAAVGQLATIAMVAGPLQVPVPLAPLVVLIGTTLVSNSCYWWWASTTRKQPVSSRTWRAVLGFLMLLDLVVLTAMLALTGGTTNPFVIFYFVNLALSGVVLSPRWAWSLTLLAVSAYGLLTYWHLPVEVLQDAARLRSLSDLNDQAMIPIALYGSWIAFAAAALVIVNFVTSLTAELQVSNRLRRQAERQRAKSEKLEALGTLAAGAAHELATPLSTIAIVVVELQRQIEQSPAELPGVADDLALVRRELDRCRAILDRMGSDSGQAKASAPELITAEEVVAETLSQLAASGRVVTDWEPGAESVELYVPSTALAQALRALITNALDATDELDPRATVGLKVDQLGNALRLRIEDRGPGMPPEILDRASEPFFTTKAPGQGMGLGLFLARSVVERLGGSLRLESNQGEGALVTVVLPTGKPNPV